MRPTAGCCWCSSVAGSGSGCRAGPAKLGGPGWAYLWPRSGIREERHPPPDSALRSCGARWCRGQPPEDEVRRCARVAERPKAENAAPRGRSRDARLPLAFLQKGRRIASRRGGGGGDGCGRRLKRLRAQEWKPVVCRPRRAAEQSPNRDAPVHFVPQWEPRGRSSAGRKRQHPPERLKPADAHHRAAAYRYAAFVLCPARTRPAQIGPPAEPGLSSSGSAGSTSPKPAPVPRPVRACDTALLPAGDARSGGSVGAGGASVRGVRGWATSPGWRVRRGRRDGVAGGGVPVGGRRRRGGRAGPGGGGRAAGCRRGRRRWRTSPCR